MIRKISMSYSRKPIPTDRFDYMASFADAEPDSDGQMMIGFGATSHDAIDDLMDQAGPGALSKSWAFS